MQHTFTLGGPTRTLDPDDWGATRQLGHQMLDDIFEHLQTLREQPVWQDIPPEVRSELKGPVPRQGQGEAAAYEQFLAQVLPYSNGNRHPRFYGWVQGTGMPLGALADMLASAMNPHMGGFNQAPALVEKQALAWMAEMMGMPAGTGGSFVSGGTMANLMGLAVARQAKAGYDFRAEGFQGGHPAMVFYCSTETHNWVQKAVAVLGQGSKWLRAIPVDAEYRMNLELLQTAIEEDRRLGHNPACVIGTAGSVNTGASDDLEALADLCRRENLWFHVDGAFGALVQITASRRIVKGIERADSLAFDLHKWMSLPFEIACLLVREDQLLVDTFAVKASYLAETDRGVIAGGLHFANRGIELTRGFKALKVWMSLKAYGLDKFAAIIEQNLEQMQHLGRLVEAHPELELMAPVTLNIVCFRHLGDDELNQELLLRLQESGRFVISSTLLGGRFCLRAANVNHRARLEDFQEMVELIGELGRSITEQGKRATFPNP